MSESMRESENENESQSEGGSGAFYQIRDSNLFALVIALAIGGCFSGWNFGLSSGINTSWSMFLNLF